MAAAAGANAPRGIAAASPHGFERIVGDEGRVARVVVDSGDGEAARLVVRQDENGELRSRAIGLAVDWLRFQVNDESVVAPVSFAVRKNEGNGQGTSCQEKRPMTNRCSCSASPN